MSRTLWKLGAALAIATVGFAMAHYGIERATLVSTAAAREGVQAETPASVMITLLTGVFLLNIAVFSALGVWSRFLRQSPDTKQLPVWSLVSVMVIAGALWILGFAQHNSYIRTLDEIPTDASMGYVFYMTVLALFGVTALVIMGVRWAPGHKRRLPEK